MLLILVLTFSALLIIFFSFSEPDGNEYERLERLTVNSNKPFVLHAL